MKRLPFPPELVAAFDGARASKAWTISGSRSRIELGDDLDECDQLVGLLPFGMDGGGGIWYVDVDDRLGRGAGAIVYLHASCGFGDARLVAKSYAALLEKLAAGLDPDELPSFDDEATAKYAGEQRVPGIDTPVTVKRVHARTGRAAEVVCPTDTLAAGLPARGGDSIFLTEEGRVHFVTLSAPATVGGIACAAGTPLSLHPQSGRPLRFTPAEPIVIDGLPLRAGHEVSVFDPVFSASTSGTLDRDHDIGGVPLAAGTHAVLLGRERALMSGTLRTAAVVGGKPLAAGTWFELIGASVYRTRPARSE